MSTKTYFSELVGRGSVLLVLFTVAFYASCFAYSKQLISIREASNLIEAYWIGSALYFTKSVSYSFAFFYKAFLKRLRLYSATRSFFLFYLLFIIMAAPVLIAVFFRHGSIISTAVVACSMKFLIAAYAGTLWAVFYVFAVISKLVACKRGTRSSKLPNAVQARRAD